MTSCPRCRRMFDDAVSFCPVDGARVHATTDDANLGQVLLGQFEVRDVCGKGAMGTVYRAYQRNMDRVVAVKVLRRELTQEQEVVRRFLREARAAAKLQHPNIVTVHLVGETDDGVPFLVMEHVDGVSLEVICEAQGAQPLARTLSLGRQIASALGEAHDHGIVHRDLKPANILVTDRSRVPDLVKVLDFGIAKLVHAPDQSMLTREGVIFGTPHYIAPEQASGAEIDHRADLYSLGVILFRLATGRLPFEGSQGMQVVLKHLREAPPRPRALEPGLPGELEELILACLAKERSARPEDAEAVIARLDRIASRGDAPRAASVAPIAPVPPSTPSAATRPLGKRAEKAASSPEATGRVPATPSGSATRSGWGTRGILTGTLLAIAIGGGVGVAGALWRDRPLVPPVAPTIQVVPAAPVTAPSTLKDPPALPKAAAELPPLALEHQLTESGLTLRCGLERPPAPGRESALFALVSDAAGALTGSDVEAEVRSPSGREERLLFGAAAPGPSRAAYTFGPPGRYRLRITATTQARTAPLVLAFDVEVAAPRRASAHRARAADRKAHEADLPVTVVPPENAPPRRVVAQSPAPAAPPPAPIVTAPAAPPPIITAPAPDPPAPSGSPDPDPQQPQPIDPYSQSQTP